jgi:hypothetical protein
MYNFECYDVTSTYNDDCMIYYYDWLADSATSSHVSAQREAFTTYTPLANSSATSVGGKEAKIAGHGTVKLLSALQISDSQARCITKLGSSKYSRDIVGHLSTISGCPIEPGV